jgi:hypothetical protein
LLDVTRRVVKQRDLSFAGRAVVPLDRARRLPAGLDWIRIREGGRTARAPVILAH